MDKYFTSLHTTIFFVCMRRRLTKTLDDTLMAEDVQMRGPNQDKWELFVACCTSQYGGPSELPGEPELPVGLKL